MTIKLFCFFLFLTYFSSSQTNPGEFTILFYNVENLFDVKDNPETNDDEFLPDGERYWNKFRLNEKLVNISKVIINSGEWQVPGIVALCEVENRVVLEKLLNFTPLKQSSYKIIHKESPDHRGIDVAFLYNPEMFYPLNYKHFPIFNKDNSIKETREILYVSGILNKTDTIHFFVNHWPSRYTGLMETREERNTAAIILKKEINNIVKEYNSPKVIVLGDFNDQPNDESIHRILGALHSESEIEGEKLYNLSAKWINNNIGTHKYHAQWSVYDQVIVSGNLLLSEFGYSCTLDDASIVELPFLLEKDEKYGGIKPKRTYYGYSYQGGFSDHLPIMLQLKRN